MPSSTHLEDKQKFMAVHTASLEMIASSPGLTPCFENSRAAYPCKQKQVSKTISQISFSRAVSFQMFLDTRFRSYQCTRRHHSEGSVIRQICIIISIVDLNSLSQKYVIRK